MEEGEVIGYTIVNEIDEVVYEATPVFHTVTAALDWWDQMSSRPGDVIVEVTKMGYAKMIKEFEGNG